MKITARICKNFAAKNFSKKIRTNIKGGEPKVSLKGFGWYATLRLSDQDYGAINVHHVAQ
jgi:hypothetical protein